MERLIKLREIQQELKERGNQTLALLLSNILERQIEKDTYTIGVIGDELVGKSTIINSLLGQELLPVTVIPSIAETIVKYGTVFTVFDANGIELKNSELSRHIEEQEHLTIMANNEFLKENSLKFIEFHGLLSKPRLSDMGLMSKVYSCDAVVLVMAAEHLLSSYECAFIDNYIKYVGSSHILLVINRLSAIAESDVSRVLKYAKDLIGAKYDNIKWTVFDATGNFETQIENNTTTKLDEEITKLLVKEASDDNMAITNTLNYIKEQLEVQLAELEHAEGRNLEEITKKKEKNEQQKELEKASLEEAVIDFQQRCNNTTESVDKFIKTQFDEIASKLLISYDNADNKYTWHENGMNELWLHLVRETSEKVNEYASEAISKDICWLNGILETKLGIPRITVDVPDTGLYDTDKLNPYGTYKNYAKIGIGGGVIIGYCLFRIVGAVVGLGSGILAYSYFAKKDSLQSEEIRRQLNSKIGDISLKTRKLSVMGIERVYSEILKEFKKEAQEILDAKYSFDYSEDNSFREKCKKIRELINKIEEV